MEKLILDFLNLTPDQVILLKDFYEKQTGNKASDIQVGHVEQDYSGGRERQLKYILGIMKNRFFLKSVESQGLTLLIDASNLGVSIENLKLYAMSCSSWTEFREKIELLMKTSQEKQ